MWNPSWSSSPVTPHQAFNPQGQLYGGDPSYQQSQAQTQAQINALQQQNALLNQQLHNQSMTHIHHLQQLMPHQQAQPTPSIPTPPFHQPPTTPTPVQLEPQTSMVTPPSQPSNPPTFDPEQILSQMKQRLTDDLVADEAHNSFTVLHPPLPPHRVTTKIHLPIAMSHTSLNRHIGHVPFLVHGRLPGMTKGLFRFQRAQVVVPVLMFQAGDTNQNPHLTGVVKTRSHFGRSLPIDRRSSSHDFNQDDRARHRSPGRSYRPPEPSHPPTWRQYEGPSKHDDYSHRQSNHRNQSTWQDCDAWGPWGTQSPPATAPA